MKEREALSTALAPSCSLRANRITQYLCKISFYGGMAALLVPPAPDNILLLNHPPFSRLHAGRRAIPARNFAAGGHEIESEDHQEYAYVNPKWFEGLEEGIPVEHPLKVTRGRKGHPLRIDCVVECSNVKCVNESTPFFLDSAGCLPLVRS